MTRLLTEQQVARLNALADEYVALGDVVLSPAAMESLTVCELVAARLEQLRAEDASIAEDIAARAE